MIIVKFINDNFYPINSILIKKKKILITIKNDKSYHN